MLQREINLTAALDRSRCLIILCCLFWPCQLFYVL